MDCIFCKIVSGEIPSTKVFENDKVLAFRDLNPVAPVHVLVIPKKHIGSVNDITDENVEYISEIFKVIPEIARQEGIVESGYRIVSNNGDDAGQTVHHLHFHILGGRKFSDGME